MRCCFCFPQKIFACLSPWKQGNGKTGKRTNAQKGRRKLCKNYFVIYCACLELCSSLAIFIYCRLIYDVEAIGCWPGSRCRQQKAESRQQKSKWGVRCVLKLLMRKLWSRPIELNWPMATPKCSPVPLWQPFDPPLSPLAIVAIRQIFPANLLANTSSVNGATQPQPQMLWQLFICPAPCSPSLGSAFPVICFWPAL